MYANKISPSLNIFDGTKFGGIVYTEEDQNLICKKLLDFEDWNEEKYGDF